MNYEYLRNMAAQPQKQKDTISYLAAHLSRFVKRMDAVLICLPQQENDGLSSLMEQAVLRCEGTPVVWGADHRWKSLMRLAFSTRASVMISTPLIVLGLAKLHAFYSVPLFVRNVVTAGYPCTDWMMDGIRKGFDCTARGCYSVGTTSIVAGFSCDRVLGVHLRESEFLAEVVNRNRRVLPEGSEGEIVLSPVSAPQLRYFTGENGRIDRRPCVCGCTSPLLTDIQPGRTESDADLLELGKLLQSWSSVLDCRLRKGDHGLEMEIIALPGERLPKLPTAAKQIVRDFDPETDEPFVYDPTQKILGF